MSSDRPPGSEKAKASGPESGPELHDPSETADLSLRSVTAHGQKWLCHLEFCAYYVLFAA